MKETTSTNASAEPSNGHSNMALAMLATLPLSPDEKAKAVRRLLGEHAQCS